MASTATIVTESMHTIAPSCNGTNASRPTPHQNAATEAVPPRHRRSRAAVAGRQRLTPQHHPATTIPTPLAHNLQEPLNVGGRQLRPRQSIGQVLKTVTHSKLQRVLAMLRAAQRTRIYPSPPRRRSRSQAGPHRQPLHPPTQARPHALTRSITDGSAPALSMNRAMSSLKSAACMISEAPLCENTQRLIAADKAWPNPPHP